MSRAHGAPLLPPCSAPAAAAFRLLALRAGGSAASSNSATSAASSAGLGALRPARTPSTSRRRSSSARSHARKRSSSAVPVGGSLASNISRSACCGAGSAAAPPEASASHGSVRAAAPSAWRSRLVDGTLTGSASTLHRAASPIGSICTRTCSSVARDAATCAPALASDHSTEVSTASSSTSHTSAAARGLSIRKATSSRCEGERKTRRPPAGVRCTACRASHVSERSATRRAPVVSVPSRASVASSADVWCVVIAQLSSVVVSTSGTVHRYVPRRGAAARTVTTIASSEACLRDLAAASSNAPTTSLSPVSARAAGSSSSCAS